jgi:hypothetical protein
MILSSAKCNSLSNLLCKLFRAKKERVVVNRPLYSKWTSDTKAGLEVAILVPTNTILVIAESGILLRIRAQMATMGVRWLKRTLKRGGDVTEMTKKRGFTCDKRVDEKLLVCNEGPASAVGEVLAKTGDGARVGAVVEVVDEVVLVLHLAAGTAIGNEGPASAVGEVLAKTGDGARVGEVVEVVLILHLLHRLLLHRLLLNLQVVQFGVHTVLNMSTA